MIKKAMDILKMEYCSLKTHSKYSVHKSKTEHDEYHKTENLQEFMDAYHRLYYSSYDLAKAVIKLEEPEKSKIFNICGMDINFELIIDVGPVEKQGAGWMSYKVHVGEFSRFVFLENKPDHPHHYPREKFIKLWKSVIEPKSQNNPEKGS